MQASLGTLAMSADSLGDEMGAVSWQYELWKSTCKH